MATTISSFSGMFPQTTEYNSNTPNVISLHKFASNGNATVGNNYTTVQVNGGGSYSYPNDGKFGKACFYGQPVSRAGYSFRRTTGDSLRWYAVGRTWVSWVKVNGSYTDPASVSGESNGGQSINTCKFEYPLTQYKQSLSNSSLTSSIQFFSNSSLVDFTDGEWHCVMFVSVATNDHRLYIDGILHDSSSTNITGRSGDNEIQIGADAYGGGSGPFAGRITEFAVFNKAFSASEAYAYGGALAV